MIQPVKSSLYWFFSEWITIMMMMMMMSATEKALVTFIIYALTVCSLRRYVDSYLCFEGKYGGDAWIGKYKWYTQRIVFTVRRRDKRAYYLAFDESGWCATLCWKSECVCIVLYFYARESKRVLPLRFVQDISLYFIRILMGTPCLNKEKLNYIRVYLKLAKSRLSLEKKILRNWII